jgi:LytS/YehU family sensor histidine kinase
MKYSGPLNDKILLLNLGQNAWTDYLPPLAACLILAAIVSTMFLLFRRMRARQSELTADLLLESELKALRAQINPHFLQNTFNFLYTQYERADKPTIIMTLHKLSAFLRDVLKNTERIIVSLEEEIDQTEKYLSLKQIIFANSFSYTIDIADDVDTFGILVPSLLLQPVVENSLKHGLTGHKSGGRIAIRMFLKNDYLVCTVSDNGEKKTPGPFTYEGLPWDKNLSQHEDPGQEGKRKGLELTWLRLSLACNKKSLRPRVGTAENHPHGFITSIYIPLK